MDPIMIITAGGLEFLWDNSVLRAGMSADFIDWSLRTG